MNADKRRRVGGAGSGSCWQPGLMAMEAAHRRPKLKGRVLRYMVGLYRTVHREMRVMVGECDVGFHSDMLADSPLQWH